MVGRRSRATDHPHHAAGPRRIPSGPCCVPGSVTRGRRPLPVGVTVVAVLGAVDGGRITGCHRRGHPVRLRGTARTVPGSEEALRPPRGPRAVAEPRSVAPSPCRRTTAPHGPPHPPVSGPAGTRARDPVGRSPSSPDDSTAPPRAAGGISGTREGLGPPGGRPGCSPAPAVRGARRGTCPSPALCRALLLALPHSWWSRLATTRPREAVGVLTDPRTATAGTAHRDALRRTAYHGLRRPRIPRARCAVAPPSGAERAGHPPRTPAPPRRPHDRARRSRPPATPCDPGGPQRHSPRRPRDDSRPHGGPGTAVRPATTRAPPAAAERGPRRRGGSAQPWAFCPT